MSTEFQPGQKVYWTDPDDGLCSGVFTIQEINGEIIAMTNEAGSYTEALGAELKILEGDK